MFISLLISLFLFSSLKGAGNYFYKQLSLKDGLASTVECVFTDRKNFVWIGTDVGLGRYDGNQLKKYTAQENLPNSLPSNQIVQIIEDKESNLWILTKSGVARYQRETDDFYIPFDEKGKPIIAFSACLTDEGVVFGATNEIYHYDYQNQKVELLVKFETDINFTVFTINQWKPDVLMCCNRWQGAVLVDIHTGKTSLPPFDCGGKIRGVYIDSKKRIWVTPYNNGIRCYDYSGNLLAEYTTRNSGLSNNVVLCMTERNGYIWIGSDGGGINILNPETKEISILEHVPGDTHSLPTNSILYLHNDIHNNIWAGSIRNGLISIRETFINTYTDAILGSDIGMSENAVLSLYEEPLNHKIWIGTDGGGINSLDPVTGKFKHYPATRKEKIASITDFGPNELLVSIFSKGLFVFDKTTGSCRPLVIVNKKINDQLCLSGKAVNLYQHTSESILLLTTPIYRYIMKSKQFDIVKMGEGVDIIGTLMPIDTRFEYSYFNDLKHIYVLNHQKNEIEVLFACPKNVDITSVSFDRKGIFWMGTNKGLAYYIPATEEYEYVPTTLFAGINSLIYDKTGKLWIGSEGTLFAYLVKEKKFIMFGESDGAMLNDYHPKPRLESFIGDIYMGGARGLLHITGNWPINTSEIPLLQLTDVSINGEMVNDKLTGSVPEIIVPWDSRAITIRVMSQEKDIQRKKMYRYQIVGLDDRHIDSYQPELVIRSLPPGNYKIMVSCSTRNGDWTVTQELLTMIVTPPWYKSWPFILCCIFLLSYAIIQFFLIALRRKENKIRWTIKEREQQLYEEKVRFLIDVSHELRTPLTLIHGPLNQILKSLPATDINHPILTGIYKQAQRMIYLINTVLDVRKMEVGVSKIELHPQLLNEWIRNICHDFIAEAEVRNICIKFQPDDHIEEVSFDADKCERIMTNLLVNALKHSPEHSEIVVASTLCPEEKKVRVSIMDQGCGLYHIDVDKLFTRFYQGNDEQAGSGIGLSYAKILVELQGGVIGAKNNEGAGATFFFELPLKTTSEQVICKPKAYLNQLIVNNDGKVDGSNSSFTTSNYSILLVDDSKELIAFLRESLEGKFAQLYTAFDGVEAMAVTRKRQPDIIVSDVMMSHKNGYELCREIKEDIEISHIPIILLTACDDRSCELQGYRNGANAYLAKPFEMDILIEMIRSLLRNREYTKMRYLHAGLLPRPEESTFSQTDETFLIKLNNLIINNMQDPKFDVAFVYREMGMSRTSLYNKLKVLTNMGASDYIIKIRMEQAVTLIKTTNLTFSEIAEKIGFSTLRYFSTAFKQYVGKTPTQYKEELKEVH